MKLFNRLYMAAYLIAMVLVHVMIGRDASFHAFMVTLFWMAAATFFGIAISCLALLAQGAPYERFAYRTMGQASIYVAIDMTCIVHLYSRTDTIGNMGLYPWICGALWVAAMVFFVLDYVQHRRQPVAC